MSPAVPWGCYNLGGTSQVQSEAVEKSLFKKPLGVVGSDGHEHRHGESPKEDSLQDGAASASGVSEEGERALWNRGLQQLGPGCCLVVALHWHLHVPVLNEQKTAPDIWNM